MTTVQQFLVETLKEISAAIAEYNEDADAESKVGLGSQISKHPEQSTHDHGFIASSAGRATLVDFDIAVSAEEKSSISGGGGVKVAALFGADVEGKSEKTGSNISRVKFRLPLNIPIVEGVDEMKKYEQRRR